MQVRNLLRGWRVDVIYVSKKKKWDKRVIEKDDEATGECVVSCKFRNVADCFKWVFSGVYGTSNDLARKFLWEELAGVHSWLSLPRGIAERKGATRISSGMGDFSEFISDHALIDFPLEGGSFTWSNNHTPPSMSRLDKFLVSPEWDGHFPCLSQRLLPRAVSDHSPVLLDSNLAEEIVLLSLRICGRNQKVQISKV